MSPGSTFLNYLALLIVIVIGVAGGKLLADWITVQIDAYRAEQASKAPGRAGRTGAASKQEPGGMKVPMPSDLIRTQQEQRRRDRDGVRLGQTCEEWRQAHTQLKSETARDEMRRHCALYERYVQDGILPGKR